MPVIWDYIRSNNNEKNNNTHREATSPSED